MALTRKGSLAFGIGTVTGGLTTPTGAAVSDISAIVSAEASQELQVNATAKDATGEVVAHAYGDAKNVLRIEGFHTAADVPGVGDDLTVAGKTGIVTRASLQASNEDFVRLSAEAEGYPGVTYTA
jgi:hypothetical protein